MAWLIVSEAAERLNIGEAAVRKRMQRNTLKHTKWQNGRVYVYMPGQEDVDLDKDVHESEHSDDKQQRPWLDITAGVSTLAIVLGLTIYGLPS